MLLQVRQAALQIFKLLAIVFYFSVFPGQQSLSLANAHGRSRQGSYRKFRPAEHDEPCLTFGSVQHFHGILFLPGFVERLVWNAIETDGDSKRIQPGTVVLTPVHKGFRLPEKLGPGSLKLLQMSVSAFGDTPDFSLHGLKARHYIP